MANNTFNRVQKMTISGAVIALYVVVMWCTQSFSFGAYQIRIATAMYALSYLFPFLVIPLGLANFISNFFGGLGLLDMVGGCIVGILTSLLIVGIRRCKWNQWLVAVPIVLVPGLGVSTWLSYLLHIPYLLEVVNLCMGQVIPAFCGVLLIKGLERALGYEKTKKG